MMAGGVEGAGGGCGNTEHCRRHTRATAGDGAMEGCNAGSRCNGTKDAQGEAVRRCEGAGEVLCSEGGGRKLRSVSESVYGEDGLDSGLPCDRLRVLIRHIAEGVPAPLDAHVEVRCAGGDQEQGQRRQDVCACSCAYLLLNMSAHRCLSVYLSLCLRLSLSHSPSYPPTHTFIKMHTYSRGTACAVRKRVDCLYTHVRIH